MNPDLGGEVARVTAGSRGIGPAAVRAPARKGARVVTGTLLPVDGGIVQAAT